MGKKQAGENTKKAAGNAKVEYVSQPCGNLTDTDQFLQKAEAANQKVAAENAKKAAAEDQDWSKGAKSNAKKFAPLPLLGSYYF